MDSIWRRVQDAAQAFAPDGMPRRKLLQIVGVILVLEGLGTLILTNKFDALWGIQPIILGAVILLIFPPRMARFSGVRKVSEVKQVSDTYGIRLVDYVMRQINNDYIVMAIGAAIIVFVILFNYLLSAIGLPLTLLNLTEMERVVVLEMGMNVPGEIRRLTEIAEPDVGLITNIQKVHLEGLGSLERLKEEKGELFRRMRSRP